MYSKGVNREAWKPGATPRYEHKHSKTRSRSIPSLGLTFLPLRRNNCTTGQTCRRQPLFFAVPHLGRCHSKENHSRQRTQSRMAGTDRLPASLMRAASCLVLKQACQFFQTGAKRASATIVCMFIDTVSWHLKHERGSPQTPASGQPAKGYDRPR